MPIIRAGDLKLLLHISLLTTTLSCAPNVSKTEVQKKPADATNEADRGATFVTFILDFSASFAPLTQGDRIALRETSHAVSDLAVQDWSPPTTIVWRKIGSESTSAKPLCETLEYSRKLIGAVNAAQALRSGLETCVETVVRESQSKGSPEPYTDIGDAIMLASQNWAHLEGRKIIVVLSDFLEDLPKGKVATDISLHGDQVVLLHRPGSTEVSDPADYLQRIDAWKRRLRTAGAGSSVALPVFRATAYSVTGALGKQPSGGTSVMLVNDLPVSSGPLSKGSAISELSSAIAKQASSWPAPVVATWFGATKPAWHAKSIAPVVYVPRLAQRTEEVNTTDKFRLQIDEWGHALQQKPDVGNGDLDGTLRLISQGDETPNRVLVILSEFNFDPPRKSNAAVAGTRVLIAYSTSDARSGANFFQRIAKWEQYFKSSGTSSVCTLDLNSLTESTVTMCLQQEQSK